MHCVCHRTFKPLHTHKCTHLYTLQESEAGEHQTQQQGGESEQGEGSGVFLPPLFASAPRGVAVVLAKGGNAVVLDLQEDEEQEDEEPEEEGESEGEMEDA